MCNATQSEVCVAVVSKGQAATSDKIAEAIPVSGIIGARCTSFAVSVLHVIYIE